jgi:hypothetical protein
MRDKSSSFVQMKPIKCAAWFILVAVISLPICYAESACEQADVCVLEQIPYIGDRSIMNLSREQALAYAEAIRGSETGYCLLFPLLLDVSGDGIPLLMLFTGERELGEGEDWYQGYILLGFNDGKARTVFRHYWTNFWNYDLFISTMNGNSILVHLYPGSVFMSSFLVHYMSVKVNNGATELVRDVSLIDRCYKVCVCDENGRVVCSQRYFLSERLMTAEERQQPYEHWQTEILQLRSFIEGYAYAEISKAEFEREMQLIPTASENILTIASRRESHHYGGFYVDESISSLLTTVFTRQHAAQIFQAFADPDFVITLSNEAESGEPEEADTERSETTRPANVPELLTEEAKQPVPEIEAPVEVEGIADEAKPSLLLPIILGSVAGVIILGGGSLYLMRRK